MRPQRFFNPRLLAAGALLLAGCANIHNDRTRTKTEGTMAGAAAGGVLGGIIGGLVSMGSPSYIAQGAVMGAQMGGGAGYAYATSVADMKAKYANEEAWLDACIAEVKTTAAKSRDYNMLARQIIDRQQHELSTLLENGKIRPRDQALAAELRTRIENSGKNADVAIEQWDHVLKEHRRVAQGRRGSPQGQELARQVQDLEREQEGLREDVQSFATMVKTLSP